MAKFIWAGPTCINLDNVAYIETGTVSDMFYAEVHFLGAIPPFRCAGQEAMQLLKSAGVVASGRIISEPAEELPDRKKRRALL